MSIFGWGVGDIMATSGLAVQVYTAYKTSSDYKHISDEVNSLRTSIYKATRHLESATLDDNNRQDGQKVLKGCQSVLEDFNSLIEGYGSGNTVQALKRAKLGTEYIGTLRARIISNTCLLNGFIQSCELLEIQAQLSGVLGLHHTSSRVPIDSITSFARSITKKAYKSLCNDLYRIGVTPETIRQKEEEIFNIFKHAISGQIDNKNATDNQSRFRPLIDFLVSPLMVAAATALHKAAAGGYRDIVLRLLESGVPIDSINGCNNTPLHFASQNGHTRTVELLLENGASIKAMGENDNTPLHLAAQGGHTSVVELLLGKGALIEARTWFKFTPLHLATRSGHTSTVKLLLEKGAPTEAIGEWQRTPLHLAAEYGHAGVAELLLRKRARIEAKKWFGETPLHIAAENGHTGMAELFLREGALIGAINDDEDTPLHIAAKNGCTRIVELLLEKGASIEALNIYNDTPLTFAVLNHHTDIVELLNNGAAKPGVHGNRV